MAATDNSINPSNNTKRNTDLRALVRHLKEAEKLASNLKANFDQQVSGATETADYAAIATDLGLTNANAEALYNLTGSLVTALAAAGVANFTNRVLE